MMFFALPTRADFSRVAWVLIAMSAIVLLAGCAGRPGPEALNVSHLVDPQAKQVTVFVATTRASVPGQGYGAGRAPELNYAAYTVSVPPGHKAGEIEWPKNGTPDPLKTFAVTAQRTLSAEEFYREVARGRAGRQGEETDVGVFVHGFNFNFQESLFRIVQMSADSNVQGVPVLFAWPSQAALTGYLADKESVTYSRDYLADVLTRLTGKPARARVLLFGHSMGGWLVMETLRQLKLTDRADVLARLSVMLAAPDVDVDVFERQMAVIGPMSPPLTILVSKDDRALQASQWLTGNSRIGALDISNPAVQRIAEKEKIVLVDVSSISPTNRLNHDRYIQFASLYPKLAQQRQDLSSVGGFILDAAAVTVSSPFRLVKLAITPPQAQ
ncbi:alpha/beta fold hydrolase [Pseudomonas sp. R2.Fl]|nr:alpha/beta fold hydrolase [Pseudomonas sp. R2.Fl]